jgi:hypothetical protein
VKSVPRRDSAVIITELQARRYQLDNDVQCVYEMLAKLKATQNRPGNRRAEMATAIINQAQPDHRVSGAALSRYELNDPDLG